MAAPPLPALCCASPYRVAARLGPPASPASAAARQLVLPGGYYRGAQGGPVAGRLVARPPAAKRGGGRGEVATPTEDGDGTRSLLQAALWGAEAAYILWLFLLPYSPGDPVWAISQATISDLIGLSLNFFFILPLVNSVCWAV
nr:unnamed protein product [Digitaria exilis]